MTLRSSRALSLPIRIFDVLERSGIVTPEQISLLSNLDIKRLTNLPTDDIELIKNSIADYLLPKVTTGDKLVPSQKIKTGCTAIDELLRGGFRKGIITEVYGESGSGKTQIALQATVHNWCQGCVYICTEDLFPVKRFDQIKQSIPNYNPIQDYGKNVFVEHITEACDLLSCIRVRLPKLLEQNDVSLIVIDSIAGPFRSEYTNYIQRAEDLKELATKLIELAQKHELAVLCINQATANFHGGHVLPSLGLAWSNMVCSRLWLHKTEQVVNINHSNLDRTSESSKNSFFIRELSVIFAPDLPNSKTKFTITSLGLQSL